MPSPHSLPRSLADLQRMVDDGVQESVYLDYKRSESLAERGRHKDVSKDVSSFLNADGGMLIYGVEETDHLPTRIDSGMPHSQFSRERLEQLILSNIAPRPDGIEVVQIDVSPSSAAYAVRVPKGYAPYQDSQSWRYYKRFNYQSAPMEHYEVEDVRSRRITIDPLLHIDVEIKHGFLVYIVVSNPGTLTASDVEFRFEPAMTWRGGNAPRIFREGSKAFAPGRRLHFLYGSFHELMAPTSAQSLTIEAIVRYNHPLVASTREDRFTIDLQDYLDSAVIESEGVEIGGKLESVLKSIHEDAKKLAEAVSVIGRIASPTGLALSQTTLRSLAALNAGASTFSLDSSRHIGVSALQEIFEIDFNLAYRIDGIRRGHDQTRLEDLEGMTQELAARVQDLLGPQDGA